MQFPTLFLRTVLALLLFLQLTPCTQAFGWPNNNDSIFPALPAAKPYIDFDGKGFLIHGKRTFIVAGELQYPRTPRAMWRDRLLRIKRAGYNTVQTYAFWNYHEPREGQFEFSGEKDLNAYLQLVHSLGMYAIVRMGPYVNAEWDTGGLPGWLRFQPGLRPMSDNAPFYKAVDPYFAKLVPILVANQINHGGPIVMVQMENEHVLDNGVGGGTDLPNAYYQWYYKKMRTMGLQVPLFFSGLNHSDDPAGDAPFDTSQRTSPWYSTEFWTGWVGVYGSAPDRALKLERATWKVIAYGGSGYTHYTMAGGTDFDTWNNNEQAASYDFGSPIGQTGDLRGAYYLCKRAAMFATSFAPLLSNSLASADGDGFTPTGIGLQITKRKGKAGEVFFLDNHTGSPIPTQLKAPDGQLYPADGPMTLAPGEIVPIFRSFPLAPGVTLQLAAARTLGAATFGSVTTLVIYGSPGEAAEVYFKAKNARIIGPMGTGLRVTPGGMVFKAKIPTAEPVVSAFQSGKQTVRILTMPLEMANRTWFLADGLIACGPDYVGDVQVIGGKVRLMTERNSLDAPPPHSLPQLLFTPDLKTPRRLVSMLVPSRKSAPPTISPWQAEAATQFAMPRFNDARWKASADPLAMGADGDISAYAWYRTSVTVPSAGPYQINLSDAGDWVSCFANGIHAENTDVQIRYEHPVPRRLIVTLRPGRNTLAFLTAHYGRNKLFNYYGPLDTIDAKGISGLVTLSPVAGSQQAINSFRWFADDHAPGDASKFAVPSLDTSGPDWHDATTSTDVFQNRVGWAWFRVTLPNVPGPHRRVHFDSIDDDGTIFLNGKQIAENVGLNAGADISLDAAWAENGPNVLAVAVQNTAGGGGLLGAVRLDSGIPDGVEIHGWKMHGGSAPPALNAAAWKTLTSVTGLGLPTFYHATFTAVAPGPVGPHPILRATTDGLSRGFVWLNGRCLGRYPEKSPVNGVYLPEALLRAGKNDLMIFDEDGSSPAGVKVIIETAASRTGSILVLR